MAIIFYSEHVETKEIIKDNLTHFQERNLQLSPLSLNTVEKIELRTNEADPVTFCPMVTLVNVLIICVVSILWLAFCCSKEINMLS